MMVHQKSSRMSVEFEKRPLPKIPFAFVIAAFSFVFGGLFDSAVLMVAAAVIAVVAVAASGIERLHARFAKLDRL